MLSFVSQLVKLINLKTPPNFSQPLKSAGRARSERQNPNSSMTRRGDCSAESRRPWDFGLDGKGRTADCSIEAEVGNVNLGSRDPGLAPCHRKMLHAGIIGDQPV
jgi:hypothetical protein